MIIGKFKAILKEKIDLKYDLTTFKFDLNPGDFKFLPGQFANLQINLENKSIKRPYTMMNSPSSKKTVEFIVRSYNAGGFTPHLSKLSLGVELELSGPFGQFTVPDNGNELILIGAGTGIAPFVSIIRDLAEKNSNRKVSLIHVAQIPETLIYKEEFEKIDSQLKNFQYIPSISRDSESWTGERGRAEVIADKKIDFSADKEIMICGPPPMVKNVMEVLFRKGFQKEKITTEQYY